MGLSNFPEWEDLKSWMKIPTVGPPIFEVERVCKGYYSCKFTRGEFEFGLGDYYYLRPMFDDIQKFARKMFDGQYEIIISDPGDEVESITR